MGDINQYASLINATKEADLSLARVTLLLFESANKVKDNNPNISTLLFVIVVNLLDSILMCYFVRDRLDENNSIIIIPNNMLRTVYRDGATTFVFHCYFLLI